MEITHYGVWPNIKQIFQTKLQKSEFVSSEIRTKNKVYESRPRTSNNISVCFGTDIFIFLFIYTEYKNSDIMLNLSLSPLDERALEKFLMDKWNGTEVVQVQHWKEEMFIFHTNEKTSIYRTVCYSCCVRIVYSTSRFT